MTAGAAGHATGTTVSLSPITLFLQADIVVQGVMLGLLIASIATWTIILVHGLRLGKVKKEAEAFEREFWRAGDVDRFSSDNQRNETAGGRVMGAGLNEWRRSTARPVVDRAGVRERIAAALDSAVGMEVDRLGGGLNILATIGSVAPFVGLFGTVWGIMRSFSSIAAAQNSSLAVVAPGIAEALFATAIGLVAAIPAVMAYNYFQRRIRVLRSEMETFEQDYLNIIKRHFLR